MATPKRTRRADGSVACKCSICDKKLVNRKALVDHIERVHHSQIPNGWPVARYENYLRTGKTEGKCVICGKPTPWNPVTEKYGRMCGSEACRKVARERANKNYIGLHGKPYTINDPEQQKKMVYSRKNAGTYVFEDETTGKKYEAMYDSSYGRGFLEMLDTFLFWPGSDIMAPSPHTYYYEYEGKKHFYIPDVYIASLNMEVELKDGGTNPNTHPKILAVDKVKERLKDEVMNSLKGQVDYIKICDKNYAKFFAVLSELRGQDIEYPKYASKFSRVTETYIPSGANYGELFRSYYLHPHKVDNPGIDEECFSKTLDDEINNALSNCTSKGKGDKIFYVYTMGADFYKRYRSTLLGAIHIYWYDKWELGHPPKYDYEWDYQEEVRVEDCFDLQDSAVQETSDPISSTVKLLRRSELLTNPMLNYDALLEYYRKQLFHKRLSKKEWVSLYNELLRVRDSLKAVINGNSENDKRLNYEAKKALEEVNRFIAYMEDQNSVNESTMVKMLAMKNYANNVLETADIFTSGWFSNYAKYADLDSARGEVLTTQKTVKSLTDYQRSEITRDIIQQYGEICPELKRNRCDTAGYIWIDTSNDNIVGFVRARKHEWMTWLADIKVEPGYRGHGLGDQLMDIAQKELNVHYLTVATNNDAAVNLFRKHGFGVYSSEPWCYTMTDLQKITMEEPTQESSVMEGVASHIDPNYEAKETLQLSKYRSVSIGKDVLDKYKTRYPMLKHVREDDGGLIWFDGNDVVAVCGAAPHHDTTDPSEIWIHSFEITPEYRGHGLARQILNVAMKDLNAKYLSVAKTNEVAHALYKKMGFVTYGENKDTWFMKLKGAKIPKFADPVTESIIISETDIWHNFDEWKPEKGKNILLVTGLSGGGKTTLSYELAYKHKAEVFQLDWCQHPGQMQDSPETPNYGLWQYVKSKQGKYFGKGIGVSKAWHQVVIDTFNCIREYANKNPNKLFIVEGVQIPGHLHDYDGINDFPIVIKGTSLLVSLIRRFERDGISNALRTGGENILSWYMKAEKHMGWFRGQITSESVIESSNNGLSDKDFYDPSESDVMDIVSTMSPREQRYVGCPDGDKFFWWSRVFYKEAIKIDGAPVSYILVYTAPTSRDTGHIVIGTRRGRGTNGYRRRGFSKALIQRFMKANKPASVKYIEWGYDDGNTKSAKFASDAGFHHQEKIDDGYTEKLSKRDFKKGSIALSESVTTEDLRYCIVDLDNPAIKDTIMSDWNKIVYSLHFADKTDSCSEVIRKSLIREENWYNTLESVLFSKNNLELNLDEWKPGNPLWITGTSGDGKSTLAKEYARKYNACVVETDTLLLRIGCTKEKFESMVTSSKTDPKLSMVNPDIAIIGMEYVKTHPDLPYGLDWTVVDESVLEPYFMDYFDWIMSISKTDKRFRNKKIIVEGCDVMYIPPIVMKERPLIIIGCSRVRAALQRAHREHSQGMDYLPALIKVIRRYNTSVRHLDDSKDQYWKDIRRLTTMESAHIEATRDNQSHYPVFIFLSYTGTRMARLIKSFTHDPYAHSSISFDTTLENMISFNRDGMVTENITSGIWKKNASQIKYSLYMYMATVQEYEAMKRFVDELLTRKSELKYNLLGLTNFIFGRGSEREDKFFCSEFVASVISAGDNKLLKQSPHMTTPYNLAKNKNFIFVKKGILSHYDQTVVDKIIAEKLEEGGFDNVIIK